ncbi:integral membrane protein-like protein [Byssothecium circinans]|uniref:Integral membrane protein-like protein n=1 Tax=Byssothecium circinans TaxID=147558 RepID=A0A6A5T927_9PLEO|nr:integral membrane protein-like protein [Byssothecium circinans]
MVSLEPLDKDSSTLEILPASIQKWLFAVVVLGFLSFVTSVTLMALLTYRLIRWQMKSKRTNQFVVLIFNLLWADIQQSLAFLLNVEWLKLDSVVVGNPICFTQGWLVSTGDLSSGVFCTAIGVHTFASVILDYRLSQRHFYTTIIALWVFVYSISAIGVAMHPHDIYVRSGVWCWVHHDLKDIRLWTHYIWIFIFEFGNVIIYALIYYILHMRIRSGYYSETEAKRVQAISNLMVAYPVVYVVCTLPLASARMAAMGGSPPSFARLCLAGAMITSNGWLDVLLYTLTRRIMVFSDEPPPDDNGFDTFAAFWEPPPSRFGGTCKIEAEPPTPRLGRHRPFGSLASLPIRTDSTDDLCGLPMGKGDIKLVTTTQVTSEPALPEDYEEIEELARQMKPRTPTGRYSEDSRSFNLATLPT